MRSLLPGAELLADRRRSAAPPPAQRQPLRATAAAEPAATPLPEYLVQATAAWGLLHDVPFVYLVPDERLLPVEAIRFFHLDRAWLDALVAGALSAGSGSVRAEPLAKSLSEEARTLAPGVRDLRRGRAPTANREPSGHVTGLLLRSALVSGWPGLQVRAWTTTAVPSGVAAGEWADQHPETVVPLLRLERLGPSVLLALFDGVPALVWLEEPHHAVEQGVEAQGDGYVVAIRGADGQPRPLPPVPVPLRPGAVSGVIDVGALTDALDAADPLSAPRGGAALALSLLQPPSRQRFAAEDESP